MSSTRQVIVFFDAGCLLCSHSVAWLHRLDGNDRLRFAPLQGQTARPFADILPDSLAPETMATLWIEGEEVLVFTHAEGVRRALLAAGGIAGVFARLFGVLPRSLMESGYRWIATNRYRWFGAGKACDLLSPELREKLLD